MNYMWWLQEKDFKKSDFSSTYIYNNMIDEFKICRPVITTTPYLIRNNQKEIIEYYYNAIPFLSKDYEVTYAPSLPTTGCKIYFPEDGLDISKFNGKFVYNIKALKGKITPIYIYIIYDKFEELSLHVKFLLACVATDYDNKIIEERINLGKQIQELSDDPAFIPSIHNKTDQEYYKVSDTKMTKENYVKSIKSRRNALKKGYYNKRGSNGRFLSKKD